jgi:hypothetical protein
VSLIETATQSPLSFHGGRIVLQRSGYTVLDSDR